MNKKVFFIYLLVILGIGILLPFLSFVYPSVALAKEGSFEESFGNTSNAIGSAIGASLDYTIQTAQKSLHITKQGLSFGAQSAKEGVLALRSSLSEAGDAVENIAGSKQKNIKH